MLNDINKREVMLEMLFITLIAFVSTILWSDNIVTILIMTPIIIIDLFCMLLFFNKKFSKFWDENFINGKAFEKIKAKYMRVCTGIVILFSLFTLVVGIVGQESLPIIPQWIFLIYGWCSISIAFKLNKKLDEVEEKKNR